MALHLSQSSVTTPVKLLKVAGKAGVFLSTPPLLLKQVRIGLMCIKWLEGGGIWEATLTRHRHCIFFNLKQVFVVK